MQFMRATSLPVTSLQRTMLYSARLAPDAGLNYEQMVIEFPEAMDRPRLLQAWKVLGLRHSALRTRYEWPPGSSPSQRIDDTPQVAWEEEEKDGESDSGSGDGYSARLERFLEADRRRGWRIEEGPLSRLRTFRRPDGCTTLVWSFPHVLLDGRSMTLLLADLVRIERELRAGGTPDAAPQPGCGGYLEWLAGRNWDNAAAYWRHGFREFVPPPRMALGAGASDRSEAGRTRELRAEWEGEFVARVAAFAAARGGTLNTVLQGAFGLVLSRYLGVPDLAFAAIRAARHWAGEEHGREVGLFMNSLPVRCRFEPGATVSEWLRELRRQHLEIRPHEHTPAELIPGWLDLPAGTPLVEAGFRYERGDFTDSVRRALGSETGIRVGIRERAGMPLFLSAEGEVELSLTLEYDPARCVPALAARFLGHVRSACEAMLAAPDGEMFRLPLPALPGERRQSPPLPGWGGEPPVSVLGELATLAAGRPDAVAVEDVAVRMTYAELWRRAGALAAVLGRRGVNRGDVVALSTERRPYAVASLVGIFRSGAAVLQIDATLPAERQRFMIEDAGVRVLVTDAATAPGLASLGLETVLVGEGAPEESGAAFASGTEPGPDDASYLIYTSGTTGKPKGVINTHRGLANETRAAAHLFRLGPGDRMLHMANLSFDAAFEEIFATLLAGATLVCRPVDAMDSMALFHRAVSERGITALDLTTALWAQWVSWMDREHEALPAGLRVLVVGGEKTQASTYAIWKQLSRGRVRWVNTYGPTEAAIVATGFVAAEEGAGPGATGSESAPAAGDGEVPIGRPLPHVYIRILDAHRREVPAGLPGELYIGGVGVARGYLNRPELTERSFLPDPFASAPSSGARLYKTGDLCRVREDGEIDYLGRADNQVKLRGFRIELDEVENAVSGHPGVAESVVVPVLEGGRVSALAAYAVPRVRDLTVAALKEHLASRLPKYAVPAHILLLDRLPLTANGKVDRRALPKPESPAAETPGGGPANALEERLARIFAQALRREKVGMEEGFQEAGGDSFMVMELIELAAREGFLLHPETIIRHPTVRRLAGHLAETAEAAKAGSGEGQGPISVLREAPGCPRLFLAHSTPGDVLGYGNLVHALGPGIAVYGFSSLGLTDPAHAHETIEDMAAYYVDHLVKGFPAGPYHLAGWCYGGTVVFEMAAQLARRGHEVGVVGLIDAYAHMPAGRSGKWRYHRRRAWALFRLGPARWFAYLLTKLGRGRQRPVDPEVAAGAAQRVVNRDIVRKKNMEAYYRYRGEGYRGRVTVYLSTETAPDNVYDPRGGWSLYPCTADCLPVTANHRDILKPPAVEEIARHLREAVGRHARAGR